MSVSQGAVEGIPLNMLLPKLRLLFPSLLALVLPATAARAAGSATTTALAVTANGAATQSVAAGTAVTLTATVKAGSVLVTAGTVKFCDALAAHCTDVHLVGTGGLTSAGTAVIKFVPGPGVHSYKAEFAGTTADAASSSAAAALTVDAVPTTAAIAQSGTAGDYTLKATIVGKGSTIGPTGKVSFLDTSNSNAVLGTATLGSSSEALSWATAQSPATAAEPQSVVVADFNGDGIADIAVGTNGTAATKNVGAIDILLGTGTGTFQAAKAFTGLTGDQLIVAAPFVKGGPEDIFAINNSSSTTGNGLFFIGDGKGGLGTGKSLSLGIDTATAILAGDFNGDGKQDFVVAGEAFGVPAFNVFLGNGDGTFNSGTLNATSDVPITALAAGDFTGQGYLDIAVVHSDGTVDIFLQDGAGDFFPNAGTMAGSSPTGVAIGDFNGDGKADLAITNSTQDNVSILLGDGTGNFTAAASPNTGSLPKAIAVGDFNGDGKADLAVVNSGAATVTILLGKGDGTFTAEPVLDTGNTPVALVIGSFHGADTADIAVANEDPGSTGSTGTATVLLSQLAQTATASASGIAPAAAGTHLVDASYAGDTIYHTSVSATTSLSGTAKQVAAPVLSPAAGTYSVAQKVTITDATTGAVIYYTTNGTTPTTSSTKYTASISVSATETIEAIATASGYSQSIVSSAKYTIDLATATPTFSPAAGTYTVAQSVKLASATTGATIYYTTNGTTPTTSSTKYSAAIPVSASETIKAIAVDSGLTNSAVASAAYVIDTATATPTFSPAAGTYTVAQSVKLASATTGATIYYTTNGTTPTTSSTKYSAAITVSASETIKAIAVDSGNANSAVASAAYVIDTATATPTFSPAAGTYPVAQSVKLASATSGATIYYTINGSTPTTSSTKYTAAIAVPSSRTIKAIAVATGHSNSAVASATYYIETAAATPTFSPAAGTYTAAQSVKLASATTGATIYYTTNGSTPTTSSTKYSAAIAVTASETIKAIAVDSGHANSAVASGSYVIDKVAATPTFSPAAGTYSAAQSVKLADATTGATMYYTTNGSTPTTSSTKYSAAIAVSATETIKAIAAATGYTNSAVASATYTINSSGGAVASSPTAVSFPFTNINTSSKAQTVTFTNTLKTAVTSLATTLTGTGTTSYSKTQTCGTTLAAGSSCTVSLTFNPKADGTFAATLQLTGTGVSTAVSVTATCSDPTEIAPDANTYVFNTTEGDIYVELRPDVAPKNVANFLYYVNNGTYTSSIIHRVQAGFVNQGGGYKLNSDGQIIAPTTAAPVVNEFKLSNVRGTLAMAKVSNDPNSATDQFFFNAADNSSILDGQDGGYTVIGQIVGVQGANVGSQSESLAVMDAINAVPTFTFQSPFTSIPLINYTQGEAVTPSNYVYVNSVAKYTAKTNGPATPIFSIATGTYSGPQTITLTDSTPNATIYYYLFGGSTQTTIKYTGPFVVSTSQYVVAYATAPGYSSASYDNYEYYEIE